MYSFIWIWQRIELIVCDSGLGHSADEDEIDDLEEFLHKVIPAEGDGQATAGL